jgi:hypothetical protein
MPDAVEVSRPIPAVVAPQPLPRKIPGTPIPVEAPAPIVQKTCLDRLADEALGDLQAAARLISGYWNASLDDLILGGLRAVSGADVSRLFLALVDRLYPDALAPSKSGVDRRGPQASAAAALVNVMPPHLAGVLAVESVLGWSSFTAYLTHRGAAAPSQPDAHVLLRHREEALSWLRGRLASARRSSAAPPEAK